MMTAVLPGWQDVEQTAERTRHGLRPRLARPRLRDGRARPAGPGEGRAGRSPGRAGRSPSGPETSGSAKSGPTNLQEHPAGPSVIERGSRQLGCGGLGGSAPLSP